MAGAPYEAPKIEELDVSQEPADTSAGASLPT